MGRINRWTFAGGLGTLLLAAAIPAHAVGVDGGVTFTDVAKPANGITYARAGSPTRLAKRAAIEALNPIPSANFGAVVSSTPQKPWGSPGIAIFDYDNDGDLDIYVTNGPGTPNSLYKNMLKETGQLTFVDVAAQAGVTATAQDSAGVCFGDIDNDGNEDLYVLGTSGANILFHNNGGGTFTDITAKARVAGFAGQNPSGCSMADFNGDGMLDIVVSNTHDDWTQRGPVFSSYTYWPTSQNNLLYINLGRNVFSEQGEARGIRNIAGIPEGLATYTWAVSAVDYNQDGAVDIVWADTQGGASGNNQGLIRIFENDGTGFFTDVTIDRGVDFNVGTGSWMGISFGDINCDGYLDYFATNLGRFVGGAVPINSKWFLGGPKVWTDPGVGALVGTPFGWGTSMLDFDNDGDQDIVYFGDEDLLNLIATDNPGVLLRNTGQCSAKFAWESKALMDSRFRAVQGVATGDINNDGFDDILSVGQVTLNPITAPTNRNVLWSLVLGGAAGTVFDNIATAEVVWTTRITPGVFTLIPHTFSPGTLAIEVNSANNGNNWAQVKLLGTRKLTRNGRVNLDGFGSTIAFTPNGGKRSLHPVIGGSSYASQNSRITTLGMGDSTTGVVDVQWPGPNGGVRNRLYDVKPGEKIVFPEIPCVFDAPLNEGDAVGDYVECVSEHLAQLFQGGVISRADQRRFKSSAFRAFNETHPDNPIQ